MGDVVSATGQPVSSGRRIAGVEGLRALAAVGVLTWHVWVHGATLSGYGVAVGPLTKLLDTARVGVAMFFVLSGFLLYLPFAAATARGGSRPSLRSYFWNRALRIVPAYWAILLALAVLFQHALLERPLQLAANLVFAQNYVPSYIPDAPGSLGIAPAWSLCVEVVFYALLPVVAMLGALAASRVRSLDPLHAAAVPALALGVVGLAAEVVDRAWPFGATWQEIWDTTFPTHADWFAVGMGVAVARVAWEDGRLVLPRRWPLLAAGVAAALTVLALKLYYGGTIDFIEEQTVLALACGVVLMVVVLGDGRTRMARALDWRPLALVGLVSYSLFLWHEPLLRELRSAGWMEPGSTGLVLNLAVVGAISFGFAAVTYVLVERRALRHKRSTARRGGGPARAAAEPVSGTAPQPVGADARS